MGNGQLPTHGREGALTCETFRTTLNDKEQRATMTTKEISHERQTVKAVRGFAVACHKREGRDASDTHRKRECFFILLLFHFFQCDC